MKKLLFSVVDSIKKPAASRWMAGAAVAVLFPIAAFADLTGTANVSNGQTFNFDTGVAASSGGDMLFAVTSVSSSVTPQGTATAFNNGSSGGVSEYNGLTQLIIEGSATAFSKNAIPSGVGLVFSVHTNGGNFAKVLVTAQTSSTISIQYDTFGVGGGTPTITAVLNNSSLVPNGFPNSGLSPSILFVIEGTNLANAGTPTLQNTANGLQTTLNGASISVTVGGTTVQPAIYYTCSGALNAANGCGSPLAPSLIAGVLPAATPIGSGTLTVTVNGTPSAPFPIQVVPNALGFNNYDGGTVVAQNVTGPSPSYALVTPTSAAYPGETLTLWATGLGADPGDSDTTYTGAPHSISVPLTIYIGGVQANISYQGAAPYPGTDVINVTVPQGVPTGCYVPLVGVIGNVISNVVTLPVGNGVCSDPQYGINGTQISTLNGQGTVRNGALFVEQGTSPGVNGGLPTGIAFATFSQSTSYSNGSSGLVSVGGCILNQTLTSSAGTRTGLGAGTITVTTPSGSTVTLTQTSSTPGSYEALLPAGSIPSSGGTFVFNSTAGAQVGAFGQVAVNFPNPLLSWTNQSAAATVTRSSGLTVTWTGGATGSYVVINGSSSSSLTAGAVANYTCIAPQSAGQFTVPSYILDGLPAGSGTTMVEDSTSYTSFVASGLDVGVALGAVSYQVNSTYQ